MNKVVSEDQLTKSDNEKFRDIVRCAQNGVLEVQVIDQGIGIKKKDMNSLFKLFGYLDQTKELNTKGIGLGLHICRKIICKFGGEIICQSQWQKGTTFTFLLPLSEPVHCQG